MNLSNYERFAISVAKEAGSLLLREIKDIKALDYHIPTNFKTSLDKRSDDLIRSRIREGFPSHNIYSEEQVPLENDSGLSWVVDPWDGTIPGTYGISDHYAVCISLVRSRDPILGVVYAPARKELYIAELGGGAFCNDKRINVSLEEDINHVLMGIDLGKETKQFTRASILPIFEKLISSKGITYPLTYGCASVSLSFVASGRLHAYLSLNLDPWDMAAGVIINREAGAKVTNISGDEWRLGDSSILIANPTLHKKLLDLVTS